MKLLLSTPSRVEAQQAKALLGAEGISTVLEGEERASLAGAVPAQDCWLKLYLLDDTQFDRARAALRPQLLAERNEVLQCPVCGEPIDDRFGACWRCASPPADLEPQPNVQQGIRWLLRSVAWILVAAGSIGLLLSLITPWLTPYPPRRFLSATAAGASVILLLSLRRRGRRSLNISDASPRPLD